MGLGMALLLRELERDLLVSPAKWFADLDSDARYGCALVVDVLTS